MMRHLACLVPLLGVTTLAAQTPTFVPIGHPNGTFMPRGVAGDGSVAVGMSSISSPVSGDYARRWRSGVGFDYPGPGPEPTASWCSGCSANGLVMCGGNGHAVFGDLEGWVRDGNSAAHVGQPAGHDTSDLLGISGNGAIAVGYGGHQSNANLFQAARYTLATDRWQVLGYLPGGGSSQAMACSHDGSVVVGWSDDANGRRTAFRWTANGMTAIPHVPGGGNAWARACSADGGVVVGDDDNGTQTAFVWTAATGTTSLGLFPGGSSSIALGVSPDGRYVVGSAETPNGAEAFVYDEVHGMRRLRDVLVAAGLGSQLGTWSMDWADAIAGNGPEYAIAGQGSNAISNDSAWVARVVLDPATSSPLGSPCGALLPTLTSSRPVVGQNLQLAVQGAAPAAAAAWFLSSPPAAPTPIGFGCLVRFDLGAYAGPLLAPVAIDGRANLALPLPGDAWLVGLDLVTQALVLPTAAPLGFDLTNGLLLTLGH